jgi:hypothetical protein
LTDLAFLLGEVERLRGVFTDKMVEAHGQGQECAMADLAKAEERAEKAEQARDAALRRVEEAKVLIGARNDSLCPAAREANINRAWHILNALSPSDRIEPTPEEGKD